MLNISNEPFIADPGISTYEASEIRLNERGTAAHNTVTVNNQNSSEVWSSFRVAGRAKVDILNEDKNCVLAKHNGYKKFKTFHQREWNFNNQQIEVKDNLTGKITEGTAHLWIAPSHVPVLKKNIIQNK